MSGNRCRWGFCVCVFTVLSFPLVGKGDTPDAARAQDKAEFEQLDLSEDGVLSGREAKDRLKYDADGDKRVTLTEFLAGRAKERGAGESVDAEAKFKELDKNEDGVLSGRERRGFQQFDQNGDDEISKAEFLAGSAKLSKPKVAPAANNYRHLKEKLSPRHVKVFVPFKFSFPATWKFDPNAGTEESSNMVKVERSLDLGKEGTYTQENFAVGYFDAPGSGEGLKLMVRALCQQLQSQIQRSFKECKMNETKDFTFGAYPGYGFDFTFRQPHPTKGAIDGWGRVILVSADTIKQEHGLSIIMLATSEAPELKSLEDLGVKGELPVIIKSFEVDTPVKKPSIAPPRTSLPPAAPTAPPAPPAPPAP